MEREAMLRIVGMQTVMDAGLELARRGLEGMPTDAEWIRAMSERHAATLVTRLDPFLPLDGADTRAVATSLLSTLLLTAVATAQAAQASAMNDEANG